MRLSPIVATKSSRTEPRTEPHADARTEPHAVPVIRIGRSRRLVAFSREKDSRSNGYVISDRFGAAPVIATQLLLVDEVMRAGVNMRKR